MRPTATVSPRCRSATDPQAFQGGSQVAAEIDLGDVVDADPARDVEDARGDILQKNLAVYAMSLAGVPHVDRRRAQSDIAAWTASPGRILSVAGRFPLFETAGAHKAVERGGKVGTIIVEPQR